MESPFLEVTLYSPYNLEGMEIWPQPRAAKLSCLAWVLDSLQHRQLVGRHLCDPRNLCASSRFLSVPLLLKFQVKRRFYHCCLSLLNLVATPASSPLIA